MTSDKQRKIRNDHERALRGEGYKANKHRNRPGAEGIRKALGKGGGQ